MKAGARAHERDRVPGERSHSCDLLLQDLKAAMEKTGWTPEALAAHYACNRSFIVRCLTAEKRLTADHLANLPADLATEYEARRAERRGLIVIVPLSGLAAQKALVAGLIGVMSQPQPMPVKADRMARIEPLSRADVVNR